MNICIIGAGHSGGTPTRRLSSIGTPVYGSDLDAEGVGRALAAASPERLEAFTAG